MSINYVIYILLRRSYDPFGSAGWDELLGGSVDEGRW